MITEQFSKHRRNYRQQILKQNEKAKADFKLGRINDNAFYKQFNFEKTAYRLEFFLIVNNRGGHTETGKLVKLDGNFDFKGSITYYGESLLLCYKRRYYFADGSNLLVLPTAECYMTRAFLNGAPVAPEQRWEQRLHEVLNLLYDMEGIELLMNTRKHKRLLSTFIAVVSYRLPKEWQAKAIEIVKNLRTIE